jgi:hypothetical protein
MNGRAERKFAGPGVSGLLDFGSRQSYSAITSSANARHAEERAMRKTANAILIGLFFLGALLASVGAAAAQSPPPRPLTLHAAQGAGAPTDVPGINKIDVVLTLTFDGPVRRSDVEGVALNGGGAAVPPAVLKAGRWEASESRILSLALPLEDILKAGLSYAPGTTVLSLECVLTMRGGAAFMSRVQFDISDAQGVPQPFKAVAVSTKPEPAPPLTDRVPPKVGRLNIVVTKPNPAKKGPFDDEPLAIPLAGAIVIVDFELEGMHVHTEEAMPEKGEIRVNVPLDAPVSLKWEKESRIVTCTDKAPSQTVVFSTLKIKTVSTAPVIK